MNLTSLAMVVATGLGVGYSPFAPGTAGSMVGLLLWSVMPASLAAHAGVLVAVGGLGIWSSGVAERRLGAVDPGAVVIDEVFGMLITLFMIPVDWTGALLGFLLFRVFDIVKPYPSGRLEALPGGLGVMADDGVAAVYASVVLRVLLAAGGWLAWS